MFYIDLLPLLVFTIIVLVTCPIMASYLLYHRYDLRRKSLPLRLLVPAACFLLVLGILLVLQRTFPFQIEPYFLLLIVVLSIPTIAEYRKHRKLGSKA